MSTLTHAYFGLLDNSRVEDNGVCWERQLPVNDTTVDVALWSMPDEIFEPGRLDAFAGPT
jgi:hypothetical protein